MEQWYVLKTRSGREEAAARLCEKRISHKLWSECRIPRKIKVFRSGGRLHLLEDIMFPGYLLIKTEYPKALSVELKRADAFPKPLTFEAEKSAEIPEDMIPLVLQDLDFLKTVCGENLREVMGVSQIFLSRDNRIVRADGVLSGYLDKIVKLNLHKRFAVVEVELFRGKQEVLFGLKLEQDKSDSEKHILKLSYG